nr:nuclear transport factor 2 family protein [Vulcanimicrobium alpinum]
MRSGGRDQRWERVRSSLEPVAQLSTGGSVHLSDRHLQSAGEMAYEVGIEYGTFRLAGRAIAAECRVTNVYRREGGAWKIVHHHTDVSPAMVDALRDLTRA